MGLPGPPPGTGLLRRGPDGGAGVQQTALTDRLTTPFAGRRHPEAPARGRFPLWDDPAAVRAVFSRVLARTSLDRHAIMAVCPPIDPANQRVHLMSRPRLCLCVLSAALS